MSYVDLKHLLANLALQAIADPARARWTAIAAAYGELAVAEGRLEVPWDSLRTRAEHTAASLGWHLQRQDAEYLVNQGLLDWRDAALALRSPYVAYLGYFRQQTSRLLHAVQVLTTGQRGRRITDLHRGVVLFNAGLFFECHELLEGLWKASSGPEKTFYHGVVQVAAAFYHFEKGNRHGAVTLLTKGLRKLVDAPPHYLGIDVDAFRRSLHAWAAVFTRSAGTARSQTFPCIELVK